MCGLVMEVGRIWEWECNICELMFGRYFGFVFEIGFVFGVCRVIVLIVYVLFVYIVLLISGLV